MTNSIEWETCDRVERKHAPDWYWAVGIIAVSLIVTALILENTLFAVLIGVSTVVLFLRTLQAPQRVSYALTSKGIWVGKDFTSYQLLESFAVEETYGEPTLLIKGKSIASPLMILPLGEESPDAMREFLANYLYEAELHEPLSKRIMEFLGF